MKELTSIVCFLLLTAVLVSCKSEPNALQKKETSDEPKPISTEELTKSLESTPENNTPVIINPIGQTEETIASENAVAELPNKQNMPPDELIQEDVPAAVEKTELKEKLETKTEKLNNPIKKENPAVQVIENKIDQVTKEEELKTEEIKTVIERVEEPIEAIKKPAVVLDMHKEWDYILKTYVSGTGKVNYTGISTEKNRLETYLALISNNPPTADWSRNKKLAYWINAYNAYTIKLIIDNYPLKSITDLEGGKPWDKKWIKIGGKTYSLNNIENDIIRPDFNEPRIHFAVNCAAKSCPPLRNEAWNPERLEQQLESSTKKFINNSAYNMINSGTAEVSKIFEWYAVDFGALKAFLKKYTSEPIDEIGYKEYDWSLNN